MKQILFKIIAALILTCSVICSWVWMDFKGFMNNPAAIPQSGIIFEVTKGSNLASVSRKLYQQGIIDSTFYSRLAARLYPELTHLKQGEYQLTSNMSPREIFYAMVRGNIVSYQVQFIEGWTFNDFLHELAKESRLVQTISKQTRKQLLAVLDIQFNHPEGLFYPDTYNFNKGDSDLTILKMSYKLMDRKLHKHWSERELDLPYKTPYEMLIMASIIEKEAGLQSERHRIAGVFIRRLNKNMRLQTDPTVIYGIGPEFDGNLKKRDLIRKTPYNTYVIKGLPPTPIAMPSEASLAAAAHPAEGTELYFVARGDGSHAFSSSLAEHNNAVRKYQLNRKNSEQ